MTGKIVPILVKAGISSGFVYKIKVRRFFFFWYDPGFPSYETKEKAREVAGYAGIVIPY